MAKALSVSLPLHLELCGTIEGTPVCGMLTHVTASENKIVLTSPDRWAGKRFGTMSEAASFALGIKTADGGREFVVQSSSLSPTVRHLALELGEGDRSVRKRCRDSDTSLDDVYIEAKLLLMLHCQGRLHFEPASCAGTPGPHLGGGGVVRWPTARRKRVMRLRSAIAADFRSTAAGWVGCRVVSDKVIPRPESTEGSNQRKRALAAIGTPASPFQLYVTKWLQCPAHWVTHGESSAEPDRSVLPSCIGDLDIEATLTKLHATWGRRTTTQMTELDYEWLILSSKCCVDGPDLMHWWTCAKLVCSTPVAYEHRLEVLSAAAVRMMSTRSVNQVDLPYTDTHALECIGANPELAMRRMIRADAIVDAEHADPEGIWHRLATSLLLDLT